MHQHVLFWQFYSLTQDFIIYGKFNSKHCKICVLRIYSFFFMKKTPLHVFLEKFFDWLIHRWLCSFSIDNIQLFMAKKVFKLRLYEKQKKIPRRNSTCTGNFHTISSMTSNALWIWRILDSELSQINDRGQTPSSTNVIFPGNLKFGRLGNDSLPIPEVITQEFYSFLKSFWCLLQLRPCINSIFASLQHWSEYQIK